MNSTSVPCYFLKFVRFVRVKKTITSSYEINSVDDLEKFRNMTFEELDNWCDANAKKPSEHVPSDKKKRVYFIDSVKAYLKGGHGGSGIASFERAAHKRIGPPNGGDGGAGGDIIIKAINSEPNLRHIKKAYVAGSGGSGMSNKKTGKKGSSITIHVPVGTTITEISPSKHERDLSEHLPEELQDFEFIPDDINTIVKNVNEGRPAPINNDDENFFARKIEERMKEKEFSKQIPISNNFDKSEEKEVSKIIDPITRLQKIDLLRAGEYFIASNGGKPGKGNYNFSSGKNRSPQKSTNGRDGEKKWYIFELKMIAEVGLVGFPNSGKSSLLAAISNATPKIANYPFTTLSPSIGTIQWNDSFSISVADLPGIIENAHKNRGLGLEFLKHIERTRVICFVMDMSEGEPIADLKILRNELTLYNKELLDRTAFIIANKMDLPNSTKNYEKFSQSLKDDALFHDIPIFPVSARYRKNLEPFKEKLRLLIEPSQKNQNYEENEFLALDVSDQFQKIWDKIEKE